MKYTRQFKYQCVVDYKGRKDIKMPKDCNSRIFYKYVRYWTKIYDNQGIDALKHNALNFVIYLKK